MEDNKISWHFLTLLVFNEGHSMKCISGGDLLPGSTLVVFMEGVLGGLGGLFIGKYHSIQPKYNTIINCPEKH